MTESANTREARKAHTRAELIRHARRLTARHGLTGFTIEELCEEVGVSRRTFFNYFPSKEGAVLGAGPDDAMERALTEFAYSPPAGGLLLDVLVDFLVRFFEASAPGRDEVADFMAAVEREPHLLADLLRGSGEEEDRLTQAITVRERMEAGDPAARMAAVVALGVLRRSGFEYFNLDGDLSVGDLVAINLHAARRVFHSHDLTRTPTP